MWFLAVAGSRAKGCIIARECGFDNDKILSRRTLSHMAEDTCQNTLHAFIVSSLGNCSMGNSTFNAMGLISSTLLAAESVAHFPNHVIWQLAFTVQQIKLYGTDELPAHNRAEHFP